MFASPSSENRAPRDDKCCFVGVVDVDFVLVENRNVVGVCKFWDAEERIPFDSWYDVHVLCGMARTSCWSSSMSLASSTSPLSMRNALSECCPVATNSFLFLSLLVPTLKVSPLSAMAEGMEPLRTPCFNLLMLLTSRGHRLARRPGK